MADLDLRYALEQTRKASERLDQALAGYGKNLTEHDGRSALRAAFAATQAALEAVDHDIGLECERMEDAMEAWVERRDPELEWREQQIAEAEEARARGEGDPFDGKGGVLPRDSFGR